MPLKASRRAAASLALGHAHRLAQMALWLQDGDGQADAWREAAYAAGEAERACIGAVNEALERAERGKR